MLPSFVLAVAGLTLALPVFLAWNGSRQPMPSYAGRSAESWLVGVSGYVVGAPFDTPAIEAFKAMGTNGTAFLAQALDASESPLRRIHRRIFPKLPPSVQQRFAPPPDPDHVAWQAMIILGNLPDPDPARTFPSLVRSVLQGSPRRRMNASAAILSYPSKCPQFDFAPYRPELIRALNDSPDWVQIQVAGFLVEAKWGGPELILTIQRAWTNSNPDIRRRAQDFVHQLLVNQLSNSAPHAP